MEILGVGPMELILILIIATVIFGPDKLPEIGAKLGQGLKSLRGITRDFTRETQELREAVTAPVREIQQPLKEMVAPMREELAELAPLARSVTNPQEALRQAVARELKPATAPAIAAVEAAANAASGKTPGPAPVGGALAGAAEDRPIGAATTLEDPVAAAAERAGGALPSPKTPQEALRRAVARELAAHPAPDSSPAAPAAEGLAPIPSDQSESPAGGLNAVPQAVIAAGQEASSSDASNAPHVEEVSAGTLEAATGPGGDHSVPSPDRPVQPVPFFGFPPPGAAPAAAPGGISNGTGGAVEAAGARPAAAAGGQEPAELAPQRVVRLKPRRLNRPYFGKNTAAPASAPNAGSPDLADSPHPQPVAEE